MSDTNTTNVSEDVDPESEAHAVVVKAFKSAFATYNAALSTLDEGGQERLKHAVETRFLGKSKGHGGRPPGSANKDGARTSTRAK